MQKHLFQGTGWLRIGKIGLVLVFGVILAVWLVLTPDGLLGKTDAIGYAVCHRIPLRSFYIGDRPVSLCARCSGMYLGMLIGLIFQVSMGRRAILPPKRILIPFGLFLLAFGVDGLNSYLQFFPGAPAIYEPHNVLRLATGLGLGLLVAVVLLPVVHQTLWIEAENTPTLENWKQAGLLIGLAGLGGFLMQTENPLLLYPLAIVSTLTVPLILSLCYGLFWVLIFKRENSFNGWRDAWFPLLAGLVVALIQIGLIDLLRYTFTGTWNGFSL